MTYEDRDISTVEPDGGGSRSSASGGSARHPHLPVWQETILLLAGALILAILIKALFVQAFYIPSESMEPGLVKNDRILVEKPSYWFGGTPQRGDVVVFKDPGGWLGPEDVSEASNPVTQLLTKVGLYPSGGHLVKRVIGVPGDVVECCDQQGRLLVNGKPVDESAYARPAATGCAPGSSGVCYGPMPGVKHWKTQRVPKGMLFVMGDNRAHSADSSYHLCTPNETDCSDSPWVAEDLVVGKVGAVVWPASKFRIEHRPDSFDAVPSR
ncbi:signal peptidase I [Nocardioides sp. CER19]|uniref:signal peptidase I n=1 Tax=Nocardioides sp. CER19 TaxID=3038538 RepID=UPI002447D0BB|nr:signal peptidase I [Nocardioides sp. CER19]MDH2416894.1 signal peptidase I [Nocardioides sp. CER19]